jgi:protein-arginine kinase
MIEEAIKQLKEAISKEEETAVRCGLRVALNIVQMEYLKSLSPQKKIEVIKQLKD